MGQCCVSGARTTAGVRKLCLLLPKRNATVPPFFPSGCAHNAALLPCLVVTCPSAVRVVAVDQTFSSSSSPIFRPHAYVRSYETSSPPLPIRTVKLCKQRVAGTGIRDQVITPSTILKTLRHTRGIGFRSRWAQAMHGRRPWDAEECEKAAIMGMSDRSHVGQGKREVASKDSVTPSRSGDTPAISNNRYRLRGSPQQSITHSLTAPSLLTALLASTLPSTIAQSCISLEGSDLCPAFNASSISTNSNLTGLFPFLSDVTDTASFDSGLEEYISNGFTQTRYVCELTADVRLMLTSLVTGPFWGATSILTTRQPFMQGTPQAFCAMR